MRPVHGVRRSHGARDLVALTVVEAHPEPLGDPDVRHVVGVAIKALLGTQSVSTAAPPSPSFSTIVTPAPSWAARARPRNRLGRRRR